MLTTSPKIRVAVAGAGGKMGREAVATLTADDRFEVVGLLMRQTGQAEDLSSPDSCPVFTDSQQLLTEIHPDIWVDFTDAESVVAHIDQCITYGVRPVIGATGYSKDDLERWQKQCAEHDLGGIAAPNFALGALLMVRFAKEAARLFDDVEIIELHHSGKKDAPSGTARRTATAIIDARREAAANVQEREVNTMLSAAALENQARGIDIDGIHVHSVRLPGLVAHQEVIFGGIGETLTIRHDSLSRTSFMKGLVIACERVMELKGLIYGLENLLW